MYYLFQQTDTIQNLKRAGLRNEPYSFGPVHLCTHVLHLPKMYTCVYVHACTFPIYFAHKRGLVFLNETQLLRPSPAQHSLMASSLLSVWSKFLVLVLDPNPPPTIPSTQPLPQKNGAICSLQTHLPLSHLHLGRCALGNQDPLLHGHSRSSPLFKTHLTPLSQEGFFHVSRWKCSLTLYLHLSYSI